MTKEMLSILVADDDFGDRKFLRRVLEQTGIGYTLTEIDGVSKLDTKNNQYKFDLAFIDYQMPDLNGLDFISFLRELNSYTGIIMVTGQGDEAVATEAFKKGANDYIPKNSISSGSLERIMRNTLLQMDLKKRIDEQQEEIFNFSRVVAHDIKSPITQMSQLSRLIIENLKKEEYSIVERYCNLLNNTADHSLLLINTLQEYNEAIDYKIHFDSKNSRDIVYEVLGDLNWFIEEKQASIEIDDLPVVVCCPPLIRQLVQNLIANGIKYCKAEKPQITINAEEDDDHWIISIKDNGIGISEEYLKSIFEPFNRLHTQKEYTGTGLGLATCKKIVDRHQGEIWCESDNTGSRFYFSISKKLSHTSPETEAVSA